MKLDWNKNDGLIPAIIQDAKTKEVLMLGYMNEESFALTKQSGLVTFYSRSRKSIWIKGETSGNALEVVEILPDCDQDCLLIRANPKGPTCHRQTQTCFDSEFTFLSELQRVIQNRLTENSAKSYVSRLVQSGIDRVIQKVGEEAIETVIASKNSDTDSLKNEAADLLFHLMVLLQAQETSLEEVTELLKQRHLERPKFEIAREISP